MAGSLGSLVVDISANVARFASDMDAVRKTAETSAQRMDGAFKSVLGTLKQIGVALSVAEGFALLKEHIEGAIEAAASLEKLSQRTGATVEGLANLSATAKLTNTDNDQLAVGLQKLSKSMIDAANGGQKTTAAFQAIGISTKDLIGQKPDEVFRLIAQRLNEYQDGAEKVALAQLLMGKSGANMLPLLHDLAEGGEIQSRVTAEQAKQAEEFEKNLKRLSVTFHENANALVQEFLPALSSLSENMLAAQRAGAGLLQTLISIPAKNFFAAITDTPIQERIDGARDAVKRLQDQIAAPSIKTPEFLLGLQRQAIAAKAELAGLLAQQRAVALAGGEAGDLTDQVTRRLQKPTKPVIQIKIEKTADEKAIRDAAIKDLDRSIAAQNAALTQSEQFLTRYYNRGEISLHDFYAAQQADIQEHLRVVVAEYDRELAAAEKYASVKGLKDQDLIAAEEKIREIEGKRAKAVIDAGVAFSNSVEKGRDDAEKQREAVEALDIELLKLTGHLEEAAAAQARLSLEQLPRRKLGAEGDVVAAGVIARKKIDEDIAAKQRQIGDLEANASIVEQRIALRQQIGAVGSLQALAQLGEARRAEIAQLERLVVNYDALAEKSKTPEAIIAAEQLHLKLDQLKADADPLGAKFENMFETAFADNFAKVIDGTASVRKAFSNMVNLIFSELSKLAAQDIATQIFGGGGGTGGGGNPLSFLSSFFGSGGGGSGLAAGQAGPPANLAGSSGGFFSSIASLFGAAAEGGDVSGNKAYLVGERGPELFMPGRSGSIAPAGSFGGSTVVHVHMPAGIQPTRESANLAGAAAARALAVSHARNN